MQEALDNKEQNEKNIESMGWGKPTFPDIWA